MERQSESQTVHPEAKKRGRIPWQTTKRLIKRARKLKTTPGADLVPRSDTATANSSLTKGTIPNVIVSRIASRSDKKPNRRRGKHPVRRKRSFYRRTEPETSLIGSSHHPARSPLLIERSKGQIDVQSMGSGVNKPVIKTLGGVVQPTKPLCDRSLEKRRQRSKRFVGMNQHSFVRGQLGNPQQKELLDNSTPFRLPTLTSTMTKAEPALRIPPAQAIGSLTDTYLSLHEPRSSDLHMSSLYPSMMLGEGSDLVRPSSMSMIEKFSYSTNSRPTVSPLISSPPRPTRQLKISSFLSPKKSQDSPVLGDVSEDQAPSLFGQPPVSLVNASLREVPGYRGIPPINDHSLSDFQECIPLGGSYATPMPTPSSHKSVFSRLDSPTKYRQTSLQFGRLPPPKSSPYTGESQRLDDNHLDVLGEYDGGNQPGSGLPSSTLTSILGTDNDLLHDRLRQQRSCTYARSENVLTQSQDFTYSSLSSNQLGKIKPDLQLKPDDSSCLYQLRSCAGLNVPKLLNRLTSKSYGTCRTVSQPSTSFAHVAPPNNCGETSIITQDRSVKIMDSTLPIQICESNTPTGPIPHSVLPSDILRSGSSGSRVGDVGYVRYVQDSSQIHIPLSQLGLKVVAIDCEMVGCIDVAQRPPEQVLADKMLRFGGTARTQCTKKDDIGGVLMKTKMKTVAPTKKKSKNKLTKELSIAARCSIIGYDDTVLYDKYINPAVGTDYKIINYRTPWSGIAPRHMKGAIPFHIARDEILDIISDCIVVGHNVGTDFRSLEIHNFPASQIRDTSFNTNLKKRAGLPSNNQPGALKKMALALLGRRIQTRSRVGHCSVEDATATMDLYKLEEIEWENGCNHLQ